MGSKSSTYWVSPFGYQGIYACLRLPLAFRSLPRPSSALGALASTLCSSSLDFSPETSITFLSDKIELLATGLSRLFSRLLLCAVVKVRGEFPSPSKDESLVVGRSGLEPPTSRLSGECSNQLS